MESFEFVVMTVIQGKVLETVNIVSQALQRKDVDLLQATAMLGNATDTLAQLRGEFDGLKAHAQDLASSWGVHSLFKDRRARRTKRHFSELCEDQRLQDPGEHFRVAVFYANIDIVVAQLKNRFVGMSEVAQRFSFLLPRELLRATDKDLSESASALSGQYKDDLSAEFPFQILSLRNALRPTIKKIERGTIKDLAQTLLIENQSILPSIPDVATALKLFLTIPVTVASAERSFSKLKLIKTYLRSTMSQERLSGLAVLSIESRRARSIDLKTVIQDFAQKNARRRARIK